MTILAELIVLLHFLFIIFVVLGALFSLRWRWMMWVHIPAAVWGSLLEVFAWPCPLTGVENWLRLRAGTQGYAEGFIGHYLLPVIYPSGLTREIQYWLGGMVVMINVCIYLYIITKRSVKHRSN